MVIRFTLGEGAVSDTKGQLWLAFKIIACIPLGLCGLGMLLGFVQALLGIEPKEQSPPVVADKPVEATPLKTATPPRVYTKADFITADHVGFIYSVNELKAEMQLGGKELCVTGVVNSVSTDILGQPYVTLDAQHLLGIQCMFSRDMKETLATLDKGDQVNIAGQCSGKTLGFVVVRDCRFVRLP